MTTFTLGQAPQRMTVVLSSGADFVAVLVRNDGVDWTDGAGVDLIVGAFEGGSWPGTLDGDRVTWEVDASQVADAIAAEPGQAKLIYSEGSASILWARGPVVINP